MVLRPFNHVASAKPGSSQAILQKPGLKAYIAIILMELNTSRIRFRRSWYAWVLQKSSIEYPLYGTVLPPNHQYFHFYYLLFQQL